MDNLLWFIAGGLVAYFLTGLFEGDGTNEQEDE